MKRPISIATAFCFLVSCSAAPQFVPKKDEEDLSTHTSIQQYHRLLEAPEQMPLAHSGVIIGIEKSPRENVQFQNEVHDPERLNPDAISSLPFSEDDKERQTSHFRRTLNDGKVTFVSHIVGNIGGEPTGDQSSELLYSAYSQSAFGVTTGSCPEASSNGSAYTAGWNALTCLEQRLDKHLKETQNGPNPYTHITMMVMGWNNNQEESIDRFNKILEQTKAAAASQGKDFNPLLVGLTWPSVWGGNAIFSLTNSALHVASYPARSSDADELGYVIGNHILNKVLAKLENNHDIRTVAISHSFGARIMSRAFHSSHLMETVRTGARPLLIGLQPAFSANRFAANHSHFPLLTVFTPPEGGPYQQGSEPVGPMLFTWTNNDRANQLARFATGAEHMGGAFGAERAGEIEDIFDFAEWEPTKFHETTECHRDSKEHRVLLLDAQDSIKEHGDIRNPEVGRIVWYAINCL